MSKEKTLKEKERKTSQIVWNPKCTRCGFITSIVSSIYTSKYIGYKCDNCYEFTAGVLTEYR